MLFVVRDRGNQNAFFKARKPKVHPGQLTLGLGRVKGHTRKVGGKPVPIKEHLRRSAKKREDQPVQKQEQQKSMTPAETYRAARSEGKDQKAACYATMDAHPEIDGGELVDMCWVVESGKPAPRWEHEDGSPTQEAIDWHHAADVQHDEN